MMNQERSSMHICCGPNAVHPDLMTDDERLNEVARILATGIRRWHQKNVKLYGKHENIQLDIPVGTSECGLTPNATGRMI